MNLFYYRGVSENSLFFSENGYSNHFCFCVLISYNNLIAEQNPNIFSEEQSEKLSFILSLQDKGLGYRRIAKVLNDKGITKHNGSVSGGNYVYAVLKRCKKD